MSIRDPATLTIVVAHRMEDIERHGRAVEGDDPVGDASGDAPLVAGAEDAGEAADGGEAAGVRSFFGEEEPGASPRAAILATPDAREIG